MLGAMTRTPDAWTADLRGIPVRDRGGGALAGLLGRRRDQLPAARRRPVRRSARFHPGHPRRGGDSGRRVTPAQVRPAVPAHAGDLGEFAADHRAGRPDPRRGGPRDRRAVHRRGDRARPPGRCAVPQIHAAAGHPVRRAGRSRDDPEPVAAARGRLGPRAPRRTGCCCLGCQRGRRPGTTGRGQPPSGSTAGDQGSRATQPGPGVARRRRPSHHRHRGSRSGRPARARVRSTGSDRAGRDRGAHRDARAGRDAADRHACVTGRCAERCLRQRSPGPAEPSAKLLPSAPN